VDPSGRSSEDSKCSLRGSNAGNCTVFSFVGNSAKSAFIKGAKAAANGVSAAQQDPESFKKGVGEGIANGGVETLNGLIIMASLVTVQTHTPQFSRPFGPSSNEAQNFGQTVGEVGTYAATAFAAPEVGALKIVSRGAQVTSQITRARAVSRVLNNARMTPRPTGDPFVDIVRIFPNGTNIGTGSPARPIGQAVDMVPNAKTTPQKAAELFRALIAIEGP